MPTHRSKKEKKSRVWFLIPLAVLFISLGAQLTLKPDNETIFTLQTLAMGLCFFYMPRKHRLLAILIYLGIGIAGLPVFSDGRSGWEYFSLNRVLGYFLGFILVAFMNPMKQGKWTSAFTYFISLHVIIVGMGSLLIAIGEKSFKPIPDIFSTLLPGMLIKSVLGVLLLLLIDWLRLRLNSRNSG